MYFLFDFDLFLPFLRCCCVWPVLFYVLTSSRSLFQDKMTLRHTKARLIQTESQLKQLQWEHEQLEKQFLLMQKERDELMHTFESTLSYAFFFFVLSPFFVVAGCLLRRLGSLFLL